MQTRRWVHGSVVHAEDEVELVVRRGWGTHFVERSEKDNWFHFPLTTLAEVEGRHLLLAKVFVLYRTDGTVIRSLDVYDGPRRIKTFENLAHEGDHSGDIDEWNTWEIDPPLELTYGVGVSVKVEFTEGDGAGLPDILFTTAGIELYGP